MFYFRNLSIKRKMSMAVLGTTMIALLAACGAFLIFERISYRQTMARNLGVLAEALAHNSAAALSFAEVQDTTSDAEATLKALMAEPAVVSACLYDQNGELHGGYARAGTPRSFPDRPEAIGTHFSVDSLVIVQPVTVNDKPLGTIYLRSELSGLEERLRAYTKVSGLVLLGSFSLALLFSLALQRLVLRPILALTATANRIAETRDYSARATKLSHDELGLLTDAFNQMLSDIEERTKALQAANESLRVHAGEMRQAAAVLSSSAGEIVTATGQLAASAAEVAAAVGQTTTTVAEVRQTSQFASERARFVSDQAQSAAEVAKSGKLSVDKTIHGMEGIRDQMAAIAESILSLTAQSQAIGEIIASVDDVAAQSKLLAVNAAIEAAKAGDEGKGFSVVAQEVKSLAEQSKAATAQVRSILGDIQKATNRAVLSTEQGSKSVEAGARQSAATGESISTLAESIAGAAQTAMQIAATSGEQFAGMEQVAVAMGSIKTASAQTVISTQQVEKAARQLYELGQKLQQMVESFKV